MFMMGLSWLRGLVNPEQMSILFVMWEASVHVRQLLALQGGSAVGWVTKESSINFRQGKSFLHTESIQTTSEASPTSCSICAQGKVAGPGNKPLISV
jgi:hypothetical protein